MAIATGTAIAIGAGVGLLGAGLQYAGQRRAAGAAEQAAMLQYQTAQQQLRQQHQYREQAVNYANTGLGNLMRDVDRALADANSPEELSAIRRALDTSERDLGRVEQLIGSIDPTILEASNQALSILRGGNAAGTDVLSRQRSNQRQQLVDRLREQFGSGAEQSSVGLKALADFDERTSVILEENRQTNLGQLTGIASTLSGTRSGLSTSGVGTLLGVANTAGARAGRIAGLNLQGEQLIQSGRNSVVNAMMGGAGLVQNAAGPVINNAGAPFVGDVLNAQATAQLFGNLSNIGWNVAGYGVGQAMFPNATGGYHRAPPVNAFNASPSYQLPASNPGTFNPNLWVA